MANLLLGISKNALASSPKAGLRICVARKRYPPIQQEKVMLLIYLMSNPGQRFAFECFTLYLLPQRVSSDPSLQSLWPSHRKSRFMHQSGDPLGQKAKDFSHLLRPPAGTSESVIRKASRFDILQITKNMRYH